MSRPTWRPAEPVLLVGYLGTGNIGNDVSLAVVAQAIGRSTPGTRMRVLSFGPAGATMAGLPVTALSLSRTTRLRRISRVLDRAAVKAVDLVRLGLLVARAEHVVVPGSGNLESGLGGGVWGMPWALATTAVLARLTGTRLHLVCVGADPPIDPRIGFLNKITVRLATSRSFRDELSRESVTGLGIDTSADPVVPDLAFARAENHSGAGDPARPPGRVGLGVQAWYGHANDWSSGESQHRAYITAMGEIAARLLDDGIAVTLLVGDAVDRIAFEPIGEVVADRGHDPASVDVRASSDFDDLASTMSELDAVVASRYHNLIAAVVAGRPVVSLGYGPKHDVLMDGLGQAARAHDITDIDVDLVLAQVQDLGTTDDRTAARLRTEALRRGRLVASHLDDLTRRLTGS